MMQLLQMQQQQPAAQRTRFKSLAVTKQIQKKHSYAMWARGDRWMLHEQHPTIATLAHGQG